MASTLVDLEQSPYRNEGFCAVLELAVAAARELGPGGDRARPPRDAGLDERVQREAILRLRSGATANPGLLPLLAEGRFAAFGADVPASLGEVGRALAVPDVFCLVATPGTARTRTVCEIVRSAAERGERVLLTAPTPPLVDAVIAALPDGATVIRTDQTGSGPGSIDAASAAVQQRILSRSQAAARALEPWLGDPSPATGWLRRLDTALTEAAEAQERAGRAAAHREATARAARDRLGAPLAALERELATAERAAAATAREVELLTAALRRAETSRLRRWRTGRPRTMLSDAVRRAAAARSALSRTRSAYEEGARDTRTAIENDSVVRAAAERAAFADLAARRALESAERSAHQLTRMLDGVLGRPDWTADHAGLTGFADRCRTLEPTLRGRAGLLREWRQRAARPSRQLHAELLRYADVIATSCLGAGRPEHADLEFDLVVVEDASRVPVPAALVPLVRARRAVLVGETGRPPLRDLESVRAWVSARCPAGTDAAELTALLTGSVFDRVAARAPEPNRAGLDHLPPVPERPGD
ncbi:AAA domain-containing protein [Actinoplanes sp. NPDC049802]|uniref:AAA domain-containing protein n=1 Tax=Actinoplanes sp. NPDC049802 TaxID=3154742 RepID=UPI0033C39F80